MKVFARMLILTAAVLLMAGISQASEDNWRVTIKADDGSGGNPQSTVTLGVAATGSTGGFSFPSPEPFAVVAITDGGIYGSKILPSTSPYPRIWNLSVASYGSYTASAIRLRVSTVSGATLPPGPVLGDQTAKYSLKMIDNRGVAGAPALGTIWELPVPAAHSTAAYFSLTLPRLGISMKDGTALLNEGYRIQLIQEAVPEPSSLLALGLGLGGILALRRRR